MWPLELGLGTRNPGFVAWPLELGLGTRNPGFVAWPLELGLGPCNPRFVVWPLELGLGTHNPRGFLELLKRVVLETGRFSNVEDGAYNCHALDHQLLMWQGAQAIHAGSFFYDDGECLFVWQGTPSSNRGRFGEVVRAYKAVTAQHVCQSKDTLAKIECGDPVPWPTFVRFIRLRRTSASHFTCGTFQVMGVCEEILLWLILKDPQFQVPLMFSWRYLVSRPYKFSKARRGVMERGVPLSMKGVGGAEVRPRDREVPCS